jgi:Streptomyces sporulation and cell division protein, SsgA
VPLAGTPPQIEVGLTMNSSSTVSAELGLRLVVPQQTVVPLVASLFYSKEDPYAIRIAFHVGLDEPVEWIFARDLLSNGIEGREGLGDVVVWPSSTSVDGDPGAVLNIELSSPFGQAHFEAPIKEIADFLKRTYGLVPSGQEADFVNVEAEIADLLRQAQ